MSRKIGGISTTYVLRKTKGKLHSCLVNLVEYLPSMSLGKQRGSCTVVVKSLEYLPSMSLGKQKGLQTSRKIGRISIKYVLKETKGKLHSCLVKKEKYQPSMSFGKQRVSCTVIS